MTYIVFVHDGHEWVRMSWHRNEDHAVIVAQVKVQGGFKARVISDGKIIWEG
jgi:hypothetical protein